MYDAVFVLVEAFNKILKKKPDTFRTNFRRGQIFNNGSRGIDCNTSHGWVTPWEHGDKISRHLRKVGSVLIYGFKVFSNATTKACDRDVFCNY
jgi:hypothetical protein